MNEFVTISSSSYDPANLAAQLTEKSAQGWDVVAIVPTGGDVTAFLSRTSSGAAAGDDDSNDRMSTGSSPPAASPTGISATDAAAEPVMSSASEPDGWAVAPVASSDPAPNVPSPSSAPATVIQSSLSPIGGDQSYNTGNSYQPQPAAPAPSATPAVPAGWFADPAGRYELRYWDGTTWTEHVSRAGQQFTDAPVA